MIDVKAIIEKYDLQEHAARADAYFQKLDVHSTVCRKPWASISEAPELAVGIGTVLAGLQLFHGARVMDFGCGTGWFAMSLADLGCDVVAVDFSRSALALGGQLAGKRSFRPDHIDFMPWNGKRLELDDASFDRVVCFDAFHHVPNQEVVLREMHRVLVPGGIAAFHEPGPNHSRTAQSQAEMRNFEVIENDIVIEDIERIAKEIGFARMRLAYQPKYPMFVSVAEFNAILHDDGCELARRATKHANQQHENLRVFFLNKSGNTVMDSRSAAGLAHQLSISNVKVNGELGVLSLDLVAKNVGIATWLPSAGGRIGAVNLGVGLVSGGKTDRDYHHVFFLQRQLEPGKDAATSISIPLPSGQRLGTFLLRLDLVSEGIAWFSDIGSEAILVDPLSG